MAYNQPYKQVSKNNDGASEPITALLGSILGKAGFKALAKVGTKAGTKAIAKKSAQKATKKGLGKVAAKAGEIGKNAVSKGKEVVQKGKDIYDKGAKKIADATGFEKEAIKEFGTNQASSIASNIQNKIQESKEQQPAERKSPSGVLPSESYNEDAYINPIGVSMFDHRKQYGPSMKSKYDNVNYGASSDKSLKLNTAGGKEKLKKDDDKSSLDPSNLYDDGFGDNILRNLEAPVTIKGVTFDAGDALRLGIMGYKAGKKGIEKHRLQERGGKKFKGEKKLQKENIKAASKPQMSLEERRKKIILDNTKKKPTMAQNVIGLNKRKYDNIV